MTHASADLVEHLEHYLGTIEGGWRNDTGEEGAVQVVKFSGIRAGGVPVSTLGLSKFELRSRVSDKIIRQELMMLVPPMLAKSPVPAILHQVAEEIVKDGHALLRGDVVGPRGTLILGTGMEALYAAIPVYLPDDFAVYDNRGTQVVIAWLVPISHAEAHFIFNHGWDNFEARLMKLDPDLVDVTRNSIV